MDKSFSFGVTTKEADLGRAIYVKMDAVNLQGVWPTYPEEEEVTSAGHAPKVGAFIYYLLDAERKRKLSSKESLEYVEKHKVETLDETIKRFEIQESTDFALLFAEA